MADSFDIPYNDNSSWLMVLDHNDRFLFEPVENPGHVSSVTSVPGFDNQAPALVVYTRSENINVKKRATLSLYDLSGREILSKHVNELDIHPPIRGLFYLIGKGGGHSFLCDNKYIIYKIGDRLHLKKVAVLPEDFGGIIKYSFVTTNDLLFRSKNSQAIYLVKDGRFSHPIRFDVMNEGGHFIFNEVYFPEGKTGYSIQTGKNWYCFSLFHKLPHCRALIGGYFHKVNAGGQGGNVNIYFFVINITRHSETAFGGRGYLFRVGSPIIEIASDFALAMMG
jgi:hypothetical protein